MGEQLNAFHFCVAEIQNRSKHVWKLYLNKYLLPREALTFFLFAKCRWHSEMDIEAQHKLFLLRLSMLSPCCWCWLYHTGEGIYGQEPHIVSFLDWVAEILFQLPYRNIAKFQLHQEIKPPAVIQSLVTPV